MNKNNQDTNNIPETYQYEDEEIDLFEYLLIIKRRWKLILAILVTTVIAFNPGEPTVQITAIKIELIQKIITVGIIEKNLSSMNPSHNDMLQHRVTNYSTFGKRSPVKNFGPPLL